ncbi:MAG: hypothetical protein JWO67_7209 [Streptosporangiaceae bacterium]|nr:hypothetical protein [Streptosporangiaceae bacterium]
MSMPPRHAKGPPEAGHACVGMEPERVGSDRDALASEIRGLRETLDRELPGWLIRKTDQHVLGDSPQEPPEIGTFRRLARRRQEDAVEFREVDRRTCFQPRGMPSILTARYDS